MFPEERGRLGRARTFGCLGNLGTGIAVTGKGSGVQLVPNIIIVHGISAQSDGSFSLSFVLQG